jgi:hypothetical protein
VTEYYIARQRLGKYGLKSGVAAEAEVNFLGNSTQTPVSVATNINKAIPMTTNRITEDNLMFDMVTYIRAASPL